MRGQEDRGTQHLERPRRRRCNPASPARPAANIGASATAWLAKISGYGSRSAPAPKSGVKGQPSEARSICRGRQNNADFRARHGHAAQSQRVARIIREPWPRALGAGIRHVAAPSAPARTGRSDSAMAALLERHQPGRWAIADDAAEGRRVAQRPAGVRTRAGSAPCRTAQRRRRATGRPRRRFRRDRRIAGRAIARCCAYCAGAEFRRVGLAEDHRAGLAADWRPIAQSCLRHEVAEDRLP